MPSSSSSSATPAKAGRTQQWSSKADSPRLVSVIITLQDSFLKRHRAVDRKTKDAKDFTAFWTDAVVLFNDPKYETVKLADPEGRGFAEGLVKKYSRHITDAATLEASRFNPLRSKPEKSFRGSGTPATATGGAVALDNAYNTHSSTYWNFCRGELLLFVCLHLTPSRLTSALCHFFTACAR